MTNKLIESFLKFEEFRSSKTQETNPFNDATQIDEVLRLKGGQAVTSARSGRPVLTRNNDSLKPKPSTLQRKSTSATPTPATAPKPTSNASQESEPALGGSAPKPKPTSTKQSDFGNRGDEAPGGNKDRPSSAINAARKTGSQYSEFDAGAAQAAEKRLAKEGSRGMYMGRPAGQEAIRQQKLADAKEGSRGMYTGRQTQKRTMEWSDYAGDAIKAAQQRRAEATKYYGSGPR